MEDEKFVIVKGAKDNNLKNVTLKVPRDSFVVFTGVSGSGKSSLAFGTIYAEAQRRYLDSVSPYARRLFNQMSVPDVESILGLPPAVALEQQKGTPSSRSSVGSITTLSNLLRMLYSRAGTYPNGQDIIYAEGFSPNNPQGACPNCQGLGRTYDVTEDSMVPDPNLSIEERAIAAWPPAWHGQNLKDMLVTLGFDIHTPWKKLSKKDRDWILFTEDSPKVPVYAGFNLKEVKRAIKDKMEPSYHGNFSSARKYVLDTFRTTQSSLMKKRVSKYLVNALCPVCQGKKLKVEALSVTFEKLDITELSSKTLSELKELFSPYASGESSHIAKIKDKKPAEAEALMTIAKDIINRLEVIFDLGLGYLTPDRQTSTLSPGELQRLRLGTQVHSNLFGVIYVLDEPSAGLHPSDTEALLRTFLKLKDAGNSIFVVEHEIDIIKHADWIVDMGPEAGEKGGRVLYSGPLKGLKNCSESITASHLFNQSKALSKPHRSIEKTFSLEKISIHNIKDLTVEIPLDVLVCVTGVSGSGKSSLITKALVTLMQDSLSTKAIDEDQSSDLTASETHLVEGSVSGVSHLKRLVEIDQRPIGRTPRSNIATYTGLFDEVRKLFAKTRLAKSRKYDPGQFSFNMPKGRCLKCEGEGFVMVELLFLPSVYSPCPVCHGDRFNAETLEIKYNGKSIAEVLRLSVTEAMEFFQDVPSILHTLKVISQVGLGYLRLGQPATELSGGEAQRVKLASELKRKSDNTLYVLDEPTTGLHPNDVDKLLIELQRLVDAGNSVVVVEHDMQVIAQSDWVIDLGPKAGDNGGKVVFAGTPMDMIKKPKTETGRHLAKFFSAPKL